MLMGRSTAFGSTLRRTRETIAHLLAGIAGYGAARIQDRFHTLDRLQAMENTWHEAMHAATMHRPPPPAASDHGTIPRSGNPTPPGPASTRPAD